MDLQLTLRMRKVELLHGHVLTTQTRYQQTPNREQSVIGILELQRRRLYNDGGEAYLLRFWLEGYCVTARQ